VKTFFSGVIGLFGILPGWVWAIIVAGFMAHSCGQTVKIEAGKLALSQQETKTEQQAKLKGAAEKALSDRIAAEAKTVAAAVLVARTEEQAKFKIQQEKTNVLRKENAAARADLALATDRVRSAIDAAATASFSGERLPGGAADPGGAEDGQVARFKAAGRKLTDGVLQLLTDADEAVRERNLCIGLRPVPK
jgi:hypothetical protein